MRKAGVRSATVRASTALLLVGVSGCSSVPDQVNPAEWYRSASSWLSSEPTPNTAQAAPSAIEAPLPAERTDTFPNLASVPDRPTPTVDPATRRDMVASMRRESDAAQADAAALDRRADAEVARREQPMVTSQPSLPKPAPGAAPVERPMASLALPPDATALPRPAAASAPAPAPARPEASQPAPAAATAPQPMPAPVTAQPAFQEPQAAPPPAPRTAGFTPGAPLAPRPPVLPPQPLSQRAAG